MNQPPPAHNPRPNPYVGPRAFDFGETLYGRERETYKLANLLGAERIVLFYSPSGAGKTSLIKAALVPELEEREFFTRPIIRVNREPEAHPDAPGFNRYIFSMLGSLEEAFPKEAQLPEAELARLDLAGYLQKRPRPAEANFEVFILDQFEEILVLDPTDQEAKQDFFRQVGDMLSDRSRWALFSMREDFVAALDPYTLPIPTRFSATFRLDLLGKEAALKAIQEPAAQAGVSILPEAANALNDDLRRVQVQRPDGQIERLPGPYVEPVQLQVVCYRLWERLAPGDSEIDLHDLAAVGDVDTALAMYYAEQVAAAASQTGVRERLVREWFGRKLITQQGIRSQALMGAEESEGLSNPVIRLLDQAHLVRTERRGGAFWLELSHDRLVQPVQKSNAEWFQANLSTLQRQAALYFESGQNKSLLLGGPALEEAAAWAQANGPELSPEEADFLRECQEAQEREHEARALADNQIKLAEQTRLGARLRQQALYLMIALAGALLLLLLAAFLGYQASSNLLRANEQAATATNAQGAAELQANVASTQKARAESQQSLAETAGADAALNAARADYQSMLASTQASIALAASTAAVREQARAQAESTRAVQAAAEADHQRSLALLNSLNSLALSNINYRPDLSLLLSIEAYHISHTLQTRSVLLSGLQHNLQQSVVPYAKSVPWLYSTVRVVAFQPNSQNMAWATYSDLTEVWDIEGQVRKWGRQFFTKTSALAFSPDGKVLAVGGTSDDVLLADPANGAQLKSLKSGLGVVLNLAFSPDGRYLAAVGDNNGLRLWDTATYADPTVLDSGAGVVLHALAWSPDSKYLAEGGTSSEARVWDVTGKGVAYKIPTTFYVDTLAWSPDGKYLAAAGQPAGKDNALIWERAANQSRPIPISNTDDVLTAAFSPDSTVLALGGYDQLVRLLSVRDLQPISPPLENDSPVVTLAFRPGKPSLLAWGTGNARISLYQLNDQQPFYKYFPSLGSPVQSLAFSGPLQVRLAINKDYYIRVSSLNLADGSLKTLYNSPQEATRFPLLSQQDTLLVRGKEDGVIATDNFSLSGALGDRISAFEKDPGTLTSLALSPDNQILAIGVCTQFNADTQECAQNAIVLRYLRDGQIALGPGAFSVDLFSSTFPQLIAGPITSLAYDASGHILAAGGNSHVIVLWDMTTGQPLAQLPTNDISGVTSLAFNQDGTLLASGGRSGSIVLWDMHAFQPLGEPLLGLNSAVDSLAFSLDGSRLVSGYDSGAVAAWDTDIESWLQRACAMAGRALTEAEWALYLTGEPYHPSCQP